MPRIEKVNQYKFHEQGGSEARATTETSVGQYVNITQQRHVIEAKRSNSNINVRRSHRMNAILKRHARPPIVPAIKALPIVCCSS